MQSGGGRELENRWQGVSRKCSLWEPKANDRHKAGEVFTGREVDGAGMRETLAGASSYFHLEPFQPK